MIQLPRLYAIVDRSCFSCPEELVSMATELSSAGLRLLQYRDKSGNARAILEVALRLRRQLGASLRLIMNDRADLARAADFGGVHVGQEDLSLESARKVIGPNLWLGISTHRPEQVEQADESSADYIAIGPVFATSTKARPDPVVGLEGVRRVRPLTRKPLVAIGGITRQNCRSVLAAGADSVAVISDLLPEPRKSAEEFLRLLE
jgi:thiamine-phosphate pyrophosphorylase